MNVITKEEKEAGNALAQKTGGDGGLFEGLSGKAGSSVKRMDGVDLRKAEQKPYREVLSDDERKEKELLISLLIKYISGFEQLQDKKTVPLKLRRQKLGTLRAFFEPELNEFYLRLEELYEQEDTEENIATVFSNIHAVLKRMKAKDIDYGLMARLEDEYLEKSL